MSREVVQHTDGLLATGHVDDPLTEALHESTEVYLVRGAVGLEVATILDALRDGTVNAEPILLSFLHRLLPQRHCKATTSVVPGLLLMHVRTEGRLVEVDHRPAVHDPVRHSHSKLDALSFKLNWVFTVRI